MTSTPHRLKFTVGALCVVLLSAARPSHAATQRYRLLQDESLIYVQVYKDPSAPMARLAHDHVVRAAAWTGTFDIDWDDPGACMVSLDVNPLSLIPDEPTMRRHVGLPGDLTDEQRSQVAASLRDETQLDVIRFPAITFVGSKCTLLSEDHAELDLTASIHGVRAAYRVPVRYERRGNALLIHGHLGAEHRDFDIEPYSAFGGALRNAQPLKFIFTLRGRFIL